jgi:hypothetical protein
MYIGGSRDMTMIRKQVYIEANQQQKIRRLAELRHCTEAEIVREAIDLLPEHDDPVVRRLAQAGLLAPPIEDDDLMTDEEAEQLERELDAWAEAQTEPIGLSQAVSDDRDGR